MAALTDALIQLYVSGTHVPETHVTTSTVFTSASFKAVYHPGGKMTTAVQFADRNFFRRGIYLHASGSAAKLTLTSAIDEMGLANMTANSNQDLRLNSPVRNIPMYVYWDASGTLSSSALFVTEFF